MTGEASHVAMILKILLVDDDHHLHHLAGNLLGLLVVFVERPFHMTKIALDAQRRGNELHRWDQLVRGNSLQYLDILKNLFRRFGGRGLGWWRRGLRP